MEKTDIKYQAYVQILKEELFITILKTMKMQEHILMVL